MKDNILRSDTVNANILKIEPVNSFETEVGTMFTYDVIYSVTIKAKAQYITKTPEPLALVEGSEIKVILEDKMIKGKNGEFIVHRIKPAGDYKKRW